MHTRNQTIDVMIAIDATETVIAMIITFMDLPKLKMTFKTTINDVKIFANTKEDFLHKACNKRRYQIRKLPRNAFKSTEKGIKKYSWRPARQKMVTICYSNVPFCN